MPTYEYACRDCGENLEVVQSFSDEPLTVCPKCGGELRKVFRSVGIVFKGSGFYKTDSRSAESATKTAATATDVQNAETTTGEAKSADSAPSEAKSDKSASSAPAPAAVPTA